MEITPFNVIVISFLESMIAFTFFAHVLPSSTLTIWFLIFSAINFGVLALHRLIIYPFFLSPFRNLPLPPRGSYPVLGHGLEIFKRPPGSSQFKMIKTTPQAHEYGLIRFRDFFHADRLILTSPAAMADVLVHKSYDFEKPPWVRDFLRRFIGDGLLMTEGDEHKHQRKQIMPAFSFRHIKELYPVFWSKSSELCEVIKRELLEKGEGDKVLEMNHFSTQVTLDIIGLAGLGRDIGALRNGEDDLIQNFEEILEPSAEKGAYFVLHLIFPAWLIRALPWKLNERVKITTTNLERICKEFVTEKKEKMKLEGQESVDILSIMMRSQNFSDQGLVDQLLTFLAAGHETTSSALTWATHLLAKHPNVQTRLREEIHKQIPNPCLLTSSATDSPLTDPETDLAALLESMPYLNAVCNETLRFYPTVPLTARLSIRDTSIAGTFVPKNTLSFIVPWATNRDPELWGPDAGEFKPERWIDAESGRATMNGGADSNYAFLTFLHGPRSCIGERFARAEFRALVAAFVGNFDFAMADPNEKVLEGGTITSKPVNGMRLRLRPVEWSNKTV